MPPEWVTTVDDYTVWVESVVGRSGGVVPGGLAFNIWPLEDDDNGGPATNTSLIVTNGVEW